MAENNTDGQKEIPAHFSAISLKVWPITLKIYFDYGVSWNIELVKFSCTKDDLKL